MSTLLDRVRAAKAAASTVRLDSIRPLRLPQPISGRRRTIRWLALVTAAAGVTAVVVIAAVTFSVGSHGPSFPPAGTALSTGPAQGAGPAHSTGPARATVSHVLVWQNRAGTVICGVRDQWASKPKPHRVRPTVVLCAAKGIPRSWPARFPGDAEVEIGEAGSPSSTPISEWSYQTPAWEMATLGSGTTWRRLGVTCEVAVKTVTCTNASQHGFTIGNGKYRPLPRHRPSP